MFLGPVLPGCVRFGGQGGVENSEDPREAWQPHCEQHLSPWGRPPVLAPRCARSDGGREQGHLRMEWVVSRTPGPRKAASEALPAPCQRPEPQAWGVQGTQSWALSIHSGRGFQTPRLQGHKSCLVTRYPYTQASASAPHAPAVLLFRCIHTRMYTHIHAEACVRTCTHACTHVCAHVPTCRCMHAHMHTMHACARTYTQMHTRTLGTYTQCTRAYTHNAHTRAHARDASHSCTYTHACTHANMHTQTVPTDLDVTGNHRVSMGDAP